MLDTTSTGVTALNTFMRYAGLSTDTVHDNAVISVPEMLQVNACHGRFEQTYGNDGQIKDTVANYSESEMVEVPCGPDRHLHISSVKDGAAKFGHRGYAACASTIKAMSWLLFMGRSNQIPYAIISHKIPGPEATLVEKRRASEEAVTVIVTAQELERLGLNEGYFVPSTYQETDYYREKRRGLAKRLPG